MKIKKSNIVREKVTASVNPTSIRYKSFYENVKRNYLDS